MRSLYNHEFLRLLDPWVSESDYCSCVKLKLVFGILTHQSGFFYSAIFSCVFVSSLEVILFLIFLFCLFIIRYLWHCEIVMDIVTQIFPLAWCSFFITKFINLYQLSKFINSRSQILTFRFSFYTQIQPFLL